MLLPPERVVLGRVLLVTLLACACGAPPKRSAMHDVEHGLYGVLGGGLVVAGVIAFPAAEEEEEVDKKLGNGADTASTVRTVGVISLVTGAVVLYLVGKYFGQDDPKPTEKTTGADSTPATRACDQRQSWRCLLPSAYGGERPLACGP